MLSLFIYVGLIQVCVDISYGISFSVELATINLLTYLGENDDWRTLKSDFEHRQAVFGRWAGHSTTELCRREKHRTRYFPAQPPQATKKPLSKPKELTACLVSFRMMAFQFYLFIKFKEFFFTSLLLLIYNFLCVIAPDRRF